MRPTRRSEQPRTRTDRDSGPGRRSRRTGACPVRAENCSPHGLLVARKARWGAELVETAVAGYRARTGAEVDRLLVDLDYAANALSDIGFLGQEDAPNPPIAKVVGTSRVFSAICYNSYEFGLLIGSSWMRSKKDRRSERGSGGFENSPLRPNEEDSNLSADAKVFGLRPRARSHRSRTFA
jgi:hypothetical protein